MGSSFRTKKKKKKRKEGMVRLCFCMQVRAAILESVCLLAGLVLSQTAFPWDTRKSEERSVPREAPKDCVLASQ